MSSSPSKTFHAAARSKADRPAPFSIRLSADERAYLERKAGNRPLGRYIRAKLLGDAETRRKAARVPAIDYAMLGQVLGVLGKSELATHLCLLAAAAEAGRLELAEQDRAALKDACEDVREVRALLVAALGLKSGGGS
ncbi:hypothetical protein KAJ83_10425 [Marivibrio halodurans]|uniref:Mobilization protein n=1 Tax=Marivibrio halodurans TaxID=2039722 RepID=A0A8J7SJ21_9PROT|nr:hypothetical protein [Marivibrio halodurans]MBP5857423.1 hypothetical protein [Marivibrio halodurans]